MFFVSAIKNGHPAWTIGWYSSREEAVEDLHNDRVHPGVEDYQFLILEEYRDTGLFPSVASRQLFRWDPQRSGYFETTIPGRLQRITNFAMG